MLNISHNQLNKKVDMTTFKSGKTIFTTEYFKQFNKFLLVFAVIVFITIRWWYNHTTFDSTCL